MRIYVTKDDIAHGTPCNSGRCPIARSLRRRLPKCSISVGSFGVVIENACLTLPKVAQRFIRRFDNQRRKPQPFSFILEI